MFTLANIFVGSNSIILKQTQDHLLRSHSSMVNVTVWTCKPGAFWRTAKWEALPKKNIKWTTACKCGHEDLNQLLPLKKQQNRGTGEIFDLGDHSKTHSEDSPSYENKCRRGGSTRGFRLHTCPYYAAKQFGWGQPQKVKGTHPWGQADPLHSQAIQMHRAVSVSKLSSGWKSELQWKDDTSKT